MFDSNRPLDALSPLEKELEGRLSKMKDESGRVRRFCREEIPKGWIIYLGENMEREDVLVLVRQYGFEGWESVIGNEHTRGIYFRPHTTLFFKNGSRGYSLRFIQPAYTNRDGNGNGGIKRGSQEQ